MKTLFKWSEFTSPSTLKLSSLLEKLLEHVPCKETSQRLELGLQEALVNAVVHGNLNDPSKFVRVRRVITPNWFIWQIQDQGKGLIVSKRKSSLPLAIDSSNGRGLYLIHKCFDDVRWSKKGNRMQLSSYRNSPSNDDCSQDL